MHPIACLMLNTRVINRSPDNFYMTILELYTHTDTQTQTHTHADTHTHAYIYTLIYIYIYIYVCVCVYNNLQVITISL